jgi:hypothetical protein
MSCVMGNRLILNIRFIKRQMECSTADEQSAFHLPISNSIARNHTPSLIEFARSPVTPLTPDSQSEFEIMVLRDMGQDSESRRHVVTV